MVPREFQMEVTSRRWIMVGVAACLAIGVAYLPPRGGDVFRLSDYRTPERLEERRQRGNLSSAYGLLDLLERRDATLLNRSDAGFSVYLGPAIPPRLAEDLQSLSTTLADSLPDHINGLRFALGVFVDTITMRGQFRVIPPRRVPRIHYLLPDATDNMTCTTVAVIGPDILDRVRNADETEPIGTALNQLDALGPCLFVLRYGMPGPGVKKWIRVGGYHNEAQFPVRCAQGELEACRELLVGRDDAPESIYGPDRVGVAGGSLQGLTPKFNRFDVTLLDQIRELMGDSAFARFWMSDSSMERAFAQEAGYPIELWWHEVQEELRAAAPVRATTVMTRTQLGQSLLLLVGGAFMSLIIHTRRQVSR